MFAQKRVDLEPPRGAQRAEGKIIQYKLEVRRTSKINMTPCAIIFLLLGHEPINIYLISSALFSGLLYWISWLSTAHTRIPLVSHFAQKSHPKTAPDKQKNPPEVGRRI